MLKGKGNLILWVVIGVVLVTLFSQAQGPMTRNADSPLAYSDFLSSVDGGQIQSVTIRGNEITGTFQDGHGFKTYAPEGADVVAALMKKDPEKGVANAIKIRAAPPAEPSFLMSLLISSFPVLLLIGVWVYFMRRMQGGAGGILGFGKSRARLMQQDQRRVTFTDVAGIDEAKQELRGNRRVPARTRRNSSGLAGRFPRDAC